ncbi:MAG: DUF1538 family protein [Nitrincola lacisaponensis]|nr:DUF1538 domain-containing protein [Nitrincola lacisaponensis]
MAFFQLIVIRQPLPEGIDFIDLIIGLLCVLAGLTLFIKGLQIGLFPMGESLAHAFARRSSVISLLIFAFALGFGTTVAEPALIAVAGKAAEVVAGGGLIDTTEASQNAFALQLRLVVAVSVGSAVLLGVLRILKGWPLHLLIIAGYVLVMLLTLVAPDEIVGIAYDSGGVTTSTITVPLVTALGVGLAASIKGRSPMLDGFGLIALASVMPIIFVLGFGLLML